MNGFGVGRPWLIGLMVTAAIAVVSGIATAVGEARKPRSVLARVDKLLWKRKISVVKRGVVTRQTSWLPPGAQNVRKTWIQSGSDEVVVGYGPKLEFHWGRGFGLGFGPITQQKPRMEQVYEYEQEDWLFDRTVDAEGDHATPPAWPSVALQEDQKEGERDENYVVEFVLLDGINNERATWSCKFDVWRRLQIAASHMITIEYDGRISKVDPFTV